VGVAHAEPAKHGSNSGALAETPSRAELQGVPHRSDSVPTSLWNLWITPAREGRAAQAVLATARQ
jgi:hypothetical protein